jgi:hypothetical protein
MSVFGRLSRASRECKLRLFESLLRPQSGMRVLDVGAEAGLGAGDSLQFLDTYRWPAQLSAVNLDPDHIARIRARYPGIDARVADARRLPWPDKCFDLVWSNAVIEHVGGPEDQRQMAREIMRVGRNWFVTTPNRWYPFEFHLRLPLVTWLPGQAYCWCGRWVRYGHVRQRYVFGAGPVEGIRLLSATDLRRLFPGGRIVKQRITFMAETLIAVGGERLAGNGQA